MRCARLCLATDGVVIGRWSQAFQFSSFGSTSSFLSHTLGWIAVYDMFLSICAALLPHVVACLQTWSGDGGIHVLLIRLGVRILWSLPEQEILDRDLDWRLGIILWIFLLLEGVDCITGVGLCWRHVFNVSDVGPVSVTWTYLLVLWLQLFLQLWTPGVGLLLLSVLAPVPFLIKICKSELLILLLSIKVYQGVICHFLDVLVFILLEPYSDLPEIKIQCQSLVLFMRSISLSVLLQRSWLTGAILFHNWWTLLDRTCWRFDWSLSVHETRQLEALVLILGQSLGKVGLWVHCRIADLWHFDDTLVLKIALIECSIIHCWIILVQGEIDGLLA